jgi:tRNA wybutosine-synthesizing protein 1
MLISSNFESLLKKHGYHKAGSHSAVKTCLWLNKSLRGEGKCYKFQFYGIASHRCVQMTPTMQCNQKCLHCWRPTEIDVPETGWDSPELIVEESLKAQQRLISGYGGADIIDKTLWEEAKNPRHVAISLAGEPTIYPYLDRLIDAFHSKNMTTFVVTNGTYPAMVERINPTQLYLSLNAPDEDTYRQTCNPQEEGLWERICKSLDILREKQTRTVLRITLTEGLNITNPEGYAALIDRAGPDYIEIKAYMHLGFSQKRLERSAMPTHQRIREFSERIMQYTDYKQADESQISRIVLLSKNGDVKKIV